MGLTTERKRKGKLVNQSLISLYGLANTFILKEYAGKQIWFSLWIGLHACNGIKAMNCNTGLKTNFRNDSSLQSNVYD